MVCVRVCVSEGDSVCVCVRGMGDRVCGLWPNPSSSPLHSRILAAFTVQACHSLMNSDITQMTGVVSRQLEGILDSGGAKTVFQWGN